MQWTYVLLAQMPKAAAQALSAYLQWHQEQLPKDLTDVQTLTPVRLYHFDVILSEAQYNDATPNMEMLVDLGSRSQPTRLTPIVTPYPMVTGSRMRNPLELLAVARPTNVHAKYTNYTEGNSLRLLLRCE